MTEEDSPVPLQITKPDTNIHTSSVRTVSTPHSMNQNTIVTLLAVGLDAPNTQEQESLQFLPNL